MHYNRNCFIAAVTICEVTICDCPSFLKITLTRFTSTFLNDVFIFLLRCPTSTCMYVGHLSLTGRDIGVLLDNRLDMSAQVSNVCLAA